MLVAPGALARELKVLVMGDSLSAAYGLRAEQGWVALADARSTRYAFRNASISGETTAGITRTSRTWLRSGYFLGGRGAAGGLARTTVSRLGIFG